MSPEQIIIEGDVVRRVRTDILDETLLANLAGHLTTRLATTLPILPQNPTRYISFDPEAGTGLILLETRPRRHIIQVRHNTDRFPEDAARRDDDGLSRFNVQLPYQYFAYSFEFHEQAGALARFTVGHAFLFWAKDPIREPTDTLYLAHCPNVDVSGSICWGSTRSDASSLSAKLDDQVNNFFTTQFNEDLGHTTPFGTSMTLWEANSSDDDPLAWRNWDYWDEARAVPVNEVAAHMRLAPPTNIADLNPAFIRLPELPTNFTVARAQEWLNSLEPAARRRLLAAVATTPEPEAEA
jgi:hypothetical protein